jgi:DNA-binding transcriptional ArsR family regulator
MIHDRIAKIEATLKDAASLPDRTRAELLRLLAELKSEVAPLTETHDEDAQSIAHFTTASVHEATRGMRKPDQADAALKGLKASVEGFEVSHPQLVEVVNRIAITLSNMGI